MTKFYTFSKRLIDFEDFKESDVTIVDIAHHLSRINRFGGALPEGVHYSVANHSLILAKYFEDRGELEHAQLALLHDASEAYIGDVVSGLKILLPDYKELEHKVSTVIFKKYINKFYDLKLNEVLRADKVLLWNEVRRFFPFDLEVFFPGQDTKVFGGLLGVEVKDDQEQVVPVSIKEQFIRKFMELFNV